MIDMLGFLVVWLFGELCCTLTKLLVIVSVYRRATLSKTIRPGLICIRDANQLFRSSPDLENYWAV